MDITIGVQHLTRELIIESDQTSDEVSTLVEAALRAAEARLRASGDIASAIRLAEINAHRGDRDEAFRWLNLAFDRMGPRPWLMPVVGVAHTADADKAKAACKYGAIDLEMKEQTLTLSAGTTLFTAMRYG